MPVLYVFSGAAGSGDGSSWANAFTTLTAALVPEAAGDTLYVAHDHNESTASAVTLTSSGNLGAPTKVVCVDRAGSVPPVSADRRATAQVSTTGASNLTFNGVTHYDGIIFTAGSGASGVANIALTTLNNVWLRFDNCSLRLGVTITGSLIQACASGTGGSLVELNNTTMSFAHIGHTIQVSCTFRWRNTPNALLGTIPTTLFTAGIRGAVVECNGVDFSAAGVGKTIVTLGTSQSNVFRFLDCKLDAAVTKTSTISGPGTGEIDFVRSGASGVNYTTYRIRVAGVLTEETTIVRTGGANDGTTTLAWKIVANTTCNYSMPFDFPLLVIWNDTDGSPVTATVEGIWNTGALPNDDEMWLEVGYLGDNASPLGSFANDGKADLLAVAAPQTASSETWGGSTTKFKLGVTFTPQQKGFIYARVKCAKTSSTIYIDPKITLS